MYVVVVGSRLWLGKWADAQISKVLDDLHTKYSGLLVVSSSCDKGVGSYVKGRCMKNKTEFQFIEFHARIFADVPRAKLAQVHQARNAALEELGEEFHVFVDPDRRGTFEDLIERVERAGRREMLRVYLPDRNAVLPEVKVNEQGQA
jgi:hypothetical protein